MTAVEICVDDVAGARTAEVCGADRVELCSDLLEGGITPSIGLAAATLAAVERIPVHILIRPRGGDFEYDADEAAAMLADIRAMTSLPRTVPLGFVLNALTPNGGIDRAVLTELLDACEGAPVTFSRAFDSVSDPFSALETLAELGVTRILTGGGPGTAAEGCGNLARFVSRAGERIGILAAGSIRSNNVAATVAATEVREVHLRAPEQVGGRTRTSAAEVRAVIAALRPMASPAAGLRQTGGLRSG